MSHPVSLFQGTVPQNAGASQASRVPHQASSLFFSLPFGQRMYFLILFPRRAFDFSFPLLGRRTQPVFYVLSWFVDALVAIVPFCPGPEKLALSVLLLLPPDGCGAFFRMKLKEVGLFSHLDKFELDARVNFSPFFLSGTSSTIIRPSYAGKSVSPFFCPKCCLLVFPL